MISDANFQKIYLSKRSLHISTSQANIKKNAKYFLCNGNYAFKTSRYPLKNFNVLLAIFENEIILSIKDKSVHSVVLKNKEQVLFFTDFIQSITEKKQKITQTEIEENSVRIIKE